jgi:HEAT repeat protein
VSRKTLIFLVVVVVVGGGVWGMTAYQKARKTQELLTKLAERDEAVAGEAMAQLRTRGHKLGRLLIPLLSSDNERVRWRAAVLCGEVGARQAEVADALVKLLLDPVPAVQRASALACGTLRLKPAEKALIRLLSDTTQSPLNRAFAAQALGSLHSQEAVEALVALLKQRPAAKAGEEPTKPGGAAEAGEGEGKAKAAEAEKGGEKPAEAQAKPEEAKPDDLWPARMEAARALGQIPTEKSVEALAESVRDDIEPRVDVRVAAAYALGDIGSTVAIRGSLEKAVDGMVEALSDEAGDVRIAAAMSLARVYPPKTQLSRVETALREHLDDEHYWVREAVKFAMERLKISATG